MADPFYEQAILEKLRQLRRRPYTSRSDTTGSMYGGDQPLQPLQPPSELPPILSAPPLPPPIIPPSPVRPSTANDVERLGVINRSGADLATGLPSIIAGGILNALRGAGQGTVDAFVSGDSALASPATLAMNALDWKTAEREQLAQSLKDKVASWFPDIEQSSAQNEAAETVVQYGLPGVGAAGGAHRLSQAARAGGPATVATDTLAAMLSDYMATTPETASTLADAFNLNLPTAIGEGDSDAAKRAKVAAEAGAVTLPLSALVTALGSVFKWATTPKGPAASAGATPAPSPAPTLPAQPAAPVLPSPSPAQPTVATVATPSAPEVPAPVPRMDDPAAFADYQQRLRAYQAAGLDPLEADAAAVRDQLAGVPSPAPTPPPMAAQAVPAPPPAAAQVVPDVPLVPAARAVEPVPEVPAAARAKPEPATPAAAQPYAKATAEATEQAAEEAATVAPKAGKPEATPVAAADELPAPAAKTEPPVAGAAPAAAKDQPRSVIDGRPVRTADEEQEFRQVLDDAHKAESEQFGKETADELRALRDKAEEVYIREYDHAYAKARETFDPDEASDMAFDAAGRSPEVMAARKTAEARLTKAEAALKAAAEPEAAKAKASKPKATKPTAKDIAKKALGRPAKAPTKAAEPEPATAAKPEAPAATDEAQAATRDRDALARAEIDRLHGEEVKRFGKGTAGELKALRQKADEVRAPHFTRVYDEELTKGAKPDRAVAEAVASSSRVKAVADAEAAVAARLAQAEGGAAAKPAKVAPAKEVAKKALKPKAEPAKTPSKRKGKGTTLSANPFADPQLYKGFVSRELLGGAAAGIYGSYVEEGTFGINLAWALAGMAASFAGGRIPLGKSGQALFGKEGLLLSALKKGADRLFQTKMLRSFHPRGGASSELWDMFQKARSDARYMQDNAVAVAKKIAENFTVAEREMMADWVEMEALPGSPTKSLAGGLLAIPQKVKDSADTLRRLSDDLGQRAHALGMLSDESFNALKGRYLRRYYEKHGTFFGRVAERRRSRPGAHRAVGIDASWAKGRGEFNVIDNAKRNLKVGDTVTKVQSLLSKRVQYVSTPEELKGYIDRGWLQLSDYKVRGVKGNGKAVVWRDFTADERRTMKEIRDAAYRFGRGMLEASHDIVYGEMFQMLANNPKYASKVPVGDWVEVPKTRVPGTQVHKYGKLAGMYVTPDLYNMMRSARGSWLPAESEAWAGWVENYRNLLSIWKLGKTVLTPSTHVANVTSNVMLGVMTGEVNPITDIALNRDLWRALANQDHAVAVEARKAGLSIGKSFDMDFEELESEIGALAGVKSERGILTGTLRLMTNHKIFGTPAKLYQAEDSVFKLAAYMKHRRNGLTPEEAVARAHKYFFDYSDVPIGVKAMRDSYAPFFTYYYKVIPALAETFATKPERALATFAALASLDEASYGMLYSNPMAQEEFEREYLPKWMQGDAFFMVPRSLRLWYNVLDPGVPGEEMATFLRTRFLMPGGDLFDWTNNTDLGISWWPQALGGSPLGNNPFLNTLLGMFWTGDDPYFGTPIARFENTDFSTIFSDPNWMHAENAKYMAFFLSRQLLPGGFVGLARMAEGAVGSDLISEENPVMQFFDWTGRDFAGRERTIGQALAGYFGMKVDRVNVKEQARFATYEKRKIAQDARAKARSAMRSERHNEAYKQETIDAARKYAKDLHAFRGRYDQLLKATGEPPPTD